MKFTDRGLHLIRRPATALGPLGVIALGTAWLGIASCGSTPQASSSGGGGQEATAPRPAAVSATEYAPEYANMTDPTNGGAGYVGSAACTACHEDVGEVHTISGHAYKLQPVDGNGPTYPREGTRSGIPSPPEGYDWSDVAYVIGGYIRKGRFIDDGGYVLTNDANGIDPQWNLDFPPNGTTAGFVPYENKGKYGPDHPKPYNHSCFQCHTTGARPQDPHDPVFQENRPGFAGTFEEPGVQCEACHGPGSNHLASRSGRDVYVGLQSADCGTCHTRGDDPHVIIASGGYIKHHEQWPELLASGGHADFSCTDCHDPHASTNYDRDNAVLMECADCHGGHSMAGHDGITFERDDFAEALNCESCHMPFATKSASKATSAVVGPDGRMGDTRTHIFRISTAAAGFTAMFTDNGKEVRRDGDGTAAVTVDFACLRCHNDVGNAHSMTIAEAATAARNIHTTHSGRPSDLRRLGSGGP